jgi:signal transduction histidine kinase/DNA-binding response OmpR family regulator
MGEFMKRRNLFFVGLVLLVLFIFAACGRSGDMPHRTVRVGLYENAPKIYTAENGKPAGLFVELIDAIARNENWQLQFVPCTWSECLAGLEHGEIDLMPDVAFSSERAQRFDFHRVSVASSWSQIYSHPDLVIQTLSDLAGMRVAVLNGGIQQTFLAQLATSDGIPMQFVPVKTLTEGYEAVVARSADVVVTNNFFAARNGVKYRLVETPVIFLPSTLYFATAKGRNQELLERIDAHLIDWRLDSDSIYFDALRRTMALPPEVLVPYWVRWSLAGLGGGLLLLIGVSLLLRLQVAQRTRALAQTAEELQIQRDHLEHLVNARTAELQAAKEEAEHLSRVKSDFLANMSHEIRTPMNAVLGMLYLALKGDPPPALRNHLSKAQGAARSLLGIINDILDISKIEAGKLEIEHIEFGLDAVLEQLADAVGYQAEHKGIEFLIRYDPAIPPQLIGDPLRLGQVLLNLCGNAVKFTEQGEVELSLRALTITAGELVLQVCVRDSGIGMAPEVQAKLFEKFTQADQTTTRRFGGTGLGLAISKRLVELMGGRIWVEDSLPGHGTTLCFTVRVEIALEAQARRSALVEKAGPLLAGVRVLVVDDNEVSREILAEMLRFFHIEVESVGSGTAALERLANQGGQPVDLVLMDWRMPGMNGDVATQHIHRDAAIAYKPKVVMVTAYGREDVIRLAEQAGVEGFLIKPVSPTTLLDTILSVLGRGRILGKEDRSDGGAYLTDSGRLAGAYLLLVEDNDINREFATELLRGEGMLVDEAVNGAEALEMVQQHDYDAVLMDVQMPVMDGFEATQRIRGLAEAPGGERFAALPIIAMTALAMAQDADRSSAAGMNDHVAKPIDPERLIAVLAQWIQLPAGRSRPPGFGGAASQRVADLPADLQALRVLDAQEGVKRIGGKADSYRKQLRRFREHYADAADELRRCAALADPRQAKEYCHALKGVAGNIGAQRLYECLVALDTGLKENRRLETAMLDEFAGLLQQVMQEIDGLAVEPVPLPAAIALSPERLRQLLEQLAHALRYDLGAAEPLLNELRAGTVGTPREGTVAALAARIDMFDIDGAVEELTALLAGHQTMERP